MQLAQVFAVPQQSCSIPAVMQASLHSLQQGVAAGCCHRVAASKLLLRPNSACNPRLCSSSDVLLEGVAEHRIDRRRSRRWASSAVPAGSVGTATASAQAAAPGIAIESWTGSPAQLQASQLHMPHPCCWLCSLQPPKLPQLSPVMCRLVQSDVLVACLPYDCQRVDIPQLLPSQQLKPMLHPNPAGT
jgi:hypothetical protein